MNLDFGRPERDYLGRKLCDPCWNGHHWHRNDKGEMVIDCVGGDCECDCRAILSEKLIKRKKRDKSLQVMIDTGDDVIKVGGQHRDEN